MQLVVVGLQPIEPSIGGRWRASGTMRAHAFSGLLPHHTRDDSANRAIVILGSLGLHTIDKTDAKPLPSITCLAMRRRLSWRQFDKITEDENNHVAGAFVHGEPVSRRVE